MAVDTFFESGNPSNRESWNQDGNSSILELLYPSNATLVFCRRVVLFPEYVKIIYLALSLGPGPSW
jgi:hypothetical protein